MLYSSARSAGTPNNRLQRTGTLNRSVRHRKRCRAHADLSAPYNRRSRLTHQRTWQRRRCAAAAASHRIAGGTTSLPLFEPKHCEVMDTLYLIAAPRALYSNDRLRTMQIMD